MKVAACLRQDLVKREREWGVDKLQMRPNTQQGSRPRAGKVISRRPASKLGVAVYTEPFFRLGDARYTRGLPAVTPKNKAERLHHQELQRSCSTPLLGSKKTNL